MNCFECPYAVKLTREEIIYEWLFGFRSSIAFNAFIGFSFGLLFSVMVFILSFCLIIHPLITVFGGVL